MFTRVIRTWATVLQKLGEKKSVLHYTAKPGPTEVLVSQQST